MAPKLLPSPFRLDPLTGLLCALLSLAMGTLVLFLSVPSRAQDVQRIAAIVNDKIISGYDVEQRADLVIFTSNLENTTNVRRRLRSQILRKLIDESLQLQAAKQYSISANKIDLEKAYSTIEKQNKLPQGGLDRHLTSLGVSKTTLDAQLRASISWAKLIRRRLGRNVQIGEEEVDEVLARLKANAGKLEFKISEIFLPVDSSEQDEDVRRVSRDLLKQLRRGATFSVLARQFSRGPTATQGGEIGWVRPGQLSPNLILVIKSMNIGEQSEPIRAEDGYYILRLHQRRTIAPKYQNIEKLRLKQILFAVTTEATKVEFEAKESLARKVGARTKNCADVEKVAGSLKSAVYNDLGPVLLKDLPSDIVALVENLAVGRFSAPIRNATGVMILMVCEREKIQAKSFNREIIANNLARQRLSILAQRHLRDLRRSAVVELR